MPPMRKANRPCPPCWVRDTVRHKPVDPAAAAPPAPPRTPDAPHLRACTAPSGRTQSRFSAADTTGLTNAFRSGLVDWAAVTDSGCSTRKRVDTSSSSNHSARPPLRVIADPPSCHPMRPMRWNCRTHLLARHWCAIAFGQQSSREREHVAGSEASAIDLHLQDRRWRGGTGDHSSQSLAPCCQVS